MTLPGAPEDDDGGAELRELALSAGAEPQALITGNRPAPDPRYFVGTGKAEEIRQSLLEYEAELVIFDHPLSPAQERNLERLLSCRVVDRTGLILDIFAQRASTFEGKLQVELAQLRHLSSRLVRGWSHLERQKGGIGLRGPGETQLETDRRLVANRIRQITARLESVRGRRDLSRRARDRAGLPVVALVGYTNAGKSTLFNALTGADVMVEDRLFATLDPTLRRMPLCHGRVAVLADTVGFVRHLPHELVAAFRATLEEVREARLLLHVIDASAPDRSEKIGQVNEVLQEIGADEVPQIRVFNKIDLMHADAPDLDPIAPHVELDATGTVSRVWLSASRGGGVELLREALTEHLGRELVHDTVLLPASAGRLRARFYESGRVLREESREEGGWLVEFELPRSDFERLRRDDALDTYLQRPAVLENAG